MNWHTGEYPVIGVNTYLNSEGSFPVLPKKVIRATEEMEVEKRKVEYILQAYTGEGKVKLRKFQEYGMRNENVVAMLMEANGCCSLGQFTVAVFEVVGRQRRKMQNVGNATTS